MPSTAIDTTSFPFLWCGSPATSSSGVTITLDTDFGRCGAFIRPTTCFSTHLLLLWLPTSTLICSCARRPSSFFRWLLPSTWTSSGSLSPSFFTGMALSYTGATSRSTYPRTILSSTHPSNIIVTTPSRDPALLTIRDSSSRSGTRWLGVCTPDAFACAANKQMANASAHNLRRWSSQIIRYCWSQVSSSIKMPWSLIKPKMRRWKKEKGLIIFLLSSWDFYVLFCLLFVLYSMVLWMNLSPIRCIVFSCLNSLRLDSC